MASFSDMNTKDILFTVPMEITKLREHDFKAYKNIRSNKDLLSYAIAAENIMYSAYYNMIDTHATQSKFLCETDTIREVRTVKPFAEKAKTDKHFVSDVLEELDSIPFDSLIRHFNIIFDGQSNCIHNQLNDIITDNSFEYINILRYSIESSWKSIKAVLENERQELDVYNLYGLTLQNTFYYAYNMNDIRNMLVCDFSFNEEDNVSEVTNKLCLPVLLSSIYNMLKSYVAFIEAVLLKFVSINGTIENERYKFTSLSEEMQSNMNDYYSLKKVTKNSDLKLTEETFLRPNIVHNFNKEYMTVLDFVEYKKMIFEYVNMVHGILTKYFTFKTDGYHMNVIAK